MKLVVCFPQNIISYYRKERLGRAVMDVVPKSNCTDVEKHSSCNRSITAFKTSLFGYIKYKITFPFQYNGILSGIMKNDFSFFRF